MGATGECKLVIPVSLFLPFSPFFPLSLSFPLTLGFPFFPLAALPFPSRRVQGGAPRPFGCKAVIRSDPGSGAFWGDAHAGVSSRVQLGAPRPPPYLPAECNSALPASPFTFPPSARRRSRASPLPSRRVQGGAHRPFGCKAVIRSDPGSGAFWGDAHAGASSRVQLGAPSPPLYLPAEFKAALPGLPLTFPPSARRRSRASPLPSRRVQGGAPGLPLYLPAECKAALPGLPLTFSPSARRRSQAIRVQGGDSE